MPKNITPKGFTMIPCSYLKEGDIIKHGKETFKFIAYSKDNSRTIYVKVLRLSDNVEKEIRFMRSSKAYVKNESMEVLT